MFKIFNTNKPIIGMIHLAGDTPENSIKRAMEEIQIYSEEGLHGAIIEDYHSTPEVVESVLKQISINKPDIAIGVNVLSDPYLSFEFASKYGAKFIQFDSVESKDLKLIKFKSLRDIYKNILILGGVRFKYVQPSGRSLKYDIEDGKSNCDVIVTTGEGTGKETPIMKLQNFRNELNDFPLIVGAGVNDENILDQLKITDGVIIGSYFKPNGNTFMPVERENVRKLMRKLY